MLNLSKSPKAKNYWLNLNNFRNWHYQISNKLKVKFKNEIKDKICHLKFEKKIALEFIIYYKFNRKADRSNVCSIVEKFFCDALSEFGVIPDDNDKHILYTIYKTGGVDKINPRCDINIIEIE